MSTEKLYGIPLLEKLSLAFGPSGCEDEVCAVIREQILEYADELYQSCLGNLIVKINGKEGGKKEKLMLSAHMDEVGFMINDIGDDGFLYFEPIGGFDSKVLCGRKIVIGDEHKRIPGIICSKAIHLQSAEERKQATETDKMYMDIGADSKEEAERYVGIGDFAVFDSDFVRFGNGMIKGKALDDRIGCSILCDVLRYLKENKRCPSADLYFAFTVREEVGFSGAVTAAYEIRPDRALVLEATAVADIPETPPHKQVAKTGLGGVISLMDNSTLYKREATAPLIECAKRNGIPYQIKEYVSGGNDAGHIHKSGFGVLTAALSCPSRYIHSASCVIHQDDYESMFRLVLNYVLGN